MSRKPLVQLCIALAFGFLSFEVHATPTDAVGNARLFLQAFATQPSATRKLVTDDAFVAMGDASGPFAEFMREIRPKAGWLGTCRPDKLQPRPASSLEEMTNGHAGAWLKGNNISLVQGLYHCIYADGSKNDLPVAVVMRDDKVVLLGLGRDD